MKDFVKDNFPVNSNENKEQFFDMPSEDGTVTVNLEWFLDFFGGAEPLPESMKDVDPNDETGWHRHIDFLVEQGILPQ